VRALAVRRSMLKQRASVLPEIREEGGGAGAGAGADDSGDVGPAEAPTHETLAARRQRTDADAQWRRRLAYVLSPLAFLTLLLLLDALRRRGARRDARRNTLLTCQRPLVSCLSARLLTTALASLSTSHPSSRRHHTFQDCKRRRRRLARRLAARRVEPQHESRVVWRSRGHGWLEACGLGDRTAHDGHAQGACALRLRGVCVASTRRLHAVAGVGVRWREAHVC
jgi:hypothetical protein